MSAVALGISSVLGGPGSDWFQPGSRTAARLLRVALEHDPEASDVDGGVTVMFQVPGRVSQPQFTGMRAGRLSKAAKGLVVEVSVPEGTTEVEVFIGRILLEAVEFAAEVFASRNVSADLSKARRIAVSVAADLGYRAPPSESED